MIWIDSDNVISVDGSYTQIIGSLFRDQYKKDEWVFSPNRMLLTTAVMKEIIEELNKRNRKDTP